MSRNNHLKLLQEIVWQGSIALHIKLSPAESRTYDDTDPYMIRVPRLSYLPFLLCRIHDFFSTALIDPNSVPNHGWFSSEDVPLKWQYPIGLLFDIFAGSEPASPNSMTKDWPKDQLMPLDAEFKNLHDIFINSVKEADFLRNGTAKSIMSLSMAESTGLWRSVQEHDLVYFNSVNHKLLNPPGSAIRHVPIKIYLPNTSNDTNVFGHLVQGTLRVVQSLITPMNSPVEQKTIGNVLHDLLPTIFPSRRSPIHAHAVLHGAVLPLAAPVQDLMHGAAYADGFLHLVVIMVT